MTNTLTISRELAERLIRAIDEPQPSPLYAELRALLAAPVVERQPPEKVDHPNFLEFAICDTCAAESICCEVAPNEHLCGGCYWAPINEKAHADELAELQATTARLAAENEQTKDWEGLHAAMQLQRDHWRSKAEAMTAEIERLKGGQGEAVAWRYKKSWRKDGWMLQPSQPDPLEVDSETNTIEPLYPSPPAPVSVVLPDYTDKRFFANGAFDECLYAAEVEVALRDAGIACIDKVKEMNSGQV